MSHNVRMGKVMLALYRLALISYPPGALAECVSKGDIRKLRELLADDIPCLPPGIENINDFIRKYII